MSKASGGLGTPTSCKTDGSGGKKISQDSNWRKGSFLNPFCHLVIKAVRVDSPPCQNNTQSLAELLTKHRVKLSLSKATMAVKLGVSMGTFKNLEHDRTRPSKRFWPALKLFLKQNDNSI